MMLQQDELARTKAISGLKELYVWFQPFELAMKDVWLELLSTQENLVSLKTEDFSGGPISLPLYRQIVKKNFETLVEIDIQELDIPADDSSFDLSVFQICYKLEKLFLNRRITLYVTDAEQPYVRQLDCLPESIKSLKLFHLRILSEELFTAFTQTNDSSTKGFKNLQQLNLFCCGSRGLFGITGRVLSEILMKSRPNLKEVSFSNSLNKDESFKIALDRLNLSFSELRELIKGSGRSAFDWEPRYLYDDSDDSFSYSDLE